MKLLNFKASNLFSLGEVELSLDKRGLLLVTGHSNDEGGANGSGKSSLSSKGIVWTLYGSTAAGDKADAVINRFADENAMCSGSLDVESDDGSKFRIVRSRRPNRLTIIDLLSSADISAKTEKDTQEIINKILGRTRDTFLQTDFFGQGKAANFLDLTPKAQAELLETILPFDQLTQLAETAKGFLVKLKIVYTSVERHVSEQNGKMLEAQRQERELSTSIDIWEQKHEAALAQITTSIELMQRDDPIPAKLEELKARIITLPNREETHKRLIGLHDTIAGLENYKIQYQDAGLQWTLCLRRIKDIHEPKNQTCPTCDQGMPANKYSKLYDDYINQMVKGAEAETELEKVRRTLTTINNGIQTSTSQLKEAEENVKKLNQIDQEIEQLEATRNNGLLAILQQRLEATQCEVNPYETLYSNNASTLKLVTASLSHNKARLSEIDNDRRALEFWQGAFNKELKNEFIDQICPFLETKANIHLEGMGNGQLKVKVSTTKTLKGGDDKSEFTVGVSSATGGATYEALSGGERQIVNFAFGLALSDLAEVQVDGPSYFMVLDEPFMALDARNSESLVGYLTSYLAYKKETILLVSNEESFKSLIPNRIQVIKENGITRLEDD